MTVHRFAIAVGAIGLTIALAGGLMGFAGWLGQEAIAKSWGTPVPDEPKLKIGQLAQHPGSHIYFPNQEREFLVREGATQRNLLLGPARIAWSGVPGEGNCIIAAHRDTHFRLLKDVKRGDEVVVERSGRRYRFQVKKLIVASASENKFYAATAKPTLTLVTCYPFSYFGNAPQRFIVRAELLSQAVN